MDDTKKAAEREAFEKWRATGKQGERPCDLYAEPGLWSAWQARASLSLPSVQVPPGYALVPIEPTQAMRTAGFCKNIELGGGKRNPEETYKAMIAAATSSQGGK